MKIAFHTSTEQHCGIAALSRRLIKHLKKYEEIEVVPIPKKVSFSVQKELAERLNQSDIIDIQHNHSFWGKNYLSSSFWFGYLRNFISKPTIITLHAIWPPPSLNSFKHKLGDKFGLYNFINNLVFKKNTFFIVHNEFYREILIRRGIKPNRIFTIPFGIPEPRIITEKEKDEFIKKWNLENKKIIGILGYISKYKNYDLVLHALTRLPDEVIVIFAGGVRTKDEKEYFLYFKNLIDKLNLNKRVIITGKLTTEDGMAIPLSVIDLCVVPYSDDISISYSVNFCVAYHKPTIVADTETFKRVNEKYNCFELFTKRDSSSLAGKIKTLFENKDRKKCLIEQTRKYQQEWTWEKAAKETLKVFEEVIQI